MQTKSNTKNLQNFCHTLLPILSLDDNDWYFRIPNLPTPSTLGQAGLVKAIRIRSDLQEGKHTMTFTLQSSTPNRAIANIPLDHLMILSLESFRPLVRGLAAKEQDPAPDLQPRTAQEVSDYSIRCLRAGIKLNGVHYNFYGHSNSQLKSRSCFLMAASKEEISKRIEALGDFKKMKTVGKKAKRIGLLFSSAESIMTIDPERCEDIPDVESTDYVFTDGCGLIAPKLASELARRSRILFRDSRYTPSVFQIRYRGYKGVVTVDPRMQKQKAWLKFRKSMKKFSGGGDHSFAVVEYSKPFSYGHLNDETIILLHALGVSKETLLSKQRDHFQLLSNAQTDFRDAFRFLSSINQHHLAEQVLLDGSQNMKPQIKRLINVELAKMINKRDEQRCRIFVQKSRLLFGVCDAWDVLKEGECAVKVTLEGNGLPYALKNTEVTVIRNPCLHPGDWQKFKIVERPELSHLVDCIVFSTRGKRPAADLMSGGDLDGDKFFVCWDKDLIPSTVSTPAFYPGGKEPIVFHPITDDDRLVYFAKYNNVSLGRVKNLYLDWARANGPMSAQCQELNRLFSQCVDGNRIRIPDKLETPPQPSDDASPFILDILHDDGKKRVDDMSLLLTTETKGFDVDAIQLFLNRDDIPVSEFECIKWAHLWCVRNQMSFENLLHLFDFNALTSEQKSWVLSYVPPSLSVPALVTNALCSSNILERSELQKFQLDHLGIKWKRTYDSSVDRLATLCDAIATNNEMFHRTLIVFQPHERLSLAIYIPKKIMRSRDCQIDNAGRLFAFPRSQGSQTQHRLALPTKMQYQLYCDDKNFQLFDNKRGNTWVFLGRPGKNDGEYRNIQTQGDRRRKKQAVIESGKEMEVCASINLNKFSRNLQTHIGGIRRSPVTSAEIYVISNRDVASMQNLDLWLEQVDTTEILPLFPREPRQYTIPTRNDILSPSDPQWLTEIIANEKLELLMSLESVVQYNIIFKKLISANDKGLLLQCFQYLIRNISDTVVETKELLYTMVTILQTEPTLVIAFVPFLADPDREQDPELVVLWETALLPVLQALVLSASSMGHLVLDPLRKILSSVPPGSLSINDVSDVIELAALTLRSTDLALDLFLDCLQPNAARFMSADSSLVQHLLRNLSAIALDHMEEAKNVAKRLPGLYSITLYPKAQDDDVVEIEFRLDTSGTPTKLSHVRLTTASMPSNVLVGTEYSIDALVEFSENGRARFKCLHPLPSYFADCSWIIEDCGPFVTSKSMIDAIKRLSIYQEQCCGVAAIILGLPSLSPVLPNRAHALKNITKLNESQNRAIELSLTSPLLCLWGPPGTGKTETIVEMICALQMADVKARILVTAPTHNAVDNVMRRYVKRLADQPLTREAQPATLRVSTEVRKVADDLRKYTCDAMTGQEIHSNRKALEKATRMIKHSDTIFTTCIGAGIGLLRSQLFDIVIVDEASQQTEASSLVPLVKGCSRAILVGDHVQLRPTVNPTALALEFDVSLFERLYSRANSGVVDNGLSTLMLDTQYRMHPRLCEFSSKEFYEGKLKSGISMSDRQLAACNFPFPKATALGRSDHGIIDDYERAIFIRCETKEAPGHTSKENRGQADLCLQICKLLTTTFTKEGTTHSIAVLTPYTRQSEVLKRMLASVPHKIEVSSIDGFQGREADIVIFVTVRCNEHCEIGFLKDMRRMNVALTRAKSALIVVGSRSTLTGGNKDEASTLMWGRLLGGLTEVKLEVPDIGNETKGKP